MKPVKVDYCGSKTYRVYCDNDGVDVTNLILDKFVGVGRKRKLDGKSCYLDSIIMRYRRNHLTFITADALTSTSVANSRRTALSASARQTEEAALANLRENFKQDLPKSCDQKVGIWSRIECFFLEVWPESNFSKMLNEMRDCPSDAEVPFYPMTSLQVMTYFKYLSAKTDEEVTKLNNESIYGRGLSWKSVEAALSNIRELHEMIPGAFSEP